MKNEMIRSKDFELSWYTKKSSKSFLNKLGTSFGFVIILMPIFGVLLSIGNIIDNYSDNKVAVSLFKNIAGVLFSNIGIWFALSICIGFTKNKGAAVYAALIFYLVFNVSLAAFIKVNADDSSRFSILFWHDLRVAVYTTNQFGVLTFNTGVIGGIFCGSITAILYNKFKDVKLVKGLEFFAKEKFVLIIVPIFALISAFLFMIIWPMIGYALTSVGTGVAKTPIGVDSFIFRTFQRMLIPFGSSLLWQAPMWYTSVGGDLVPYKAQLLAQYLERTTEIPSDLLTQIALIDASKVDLLASANKIIGNDNFSLTISEWIENTGEIFDKKGDQIISAAVLNSNYITVADCWNVGLRITRFLTAGFVNSMFMLPTIGVVIYFRIEKSKRKDYFGKFLVAILTSFLLGITEPVEFMFCYLSPLFFFVVYAPLVGLAGLCTSLLQIKIGSTFSTGLFDFVFNGIIPTVNNQDTRIWLFPILSIVFIGIGFVASYYFFKLTNFDPLGSTKNPRKDARLKIIQMKDLIGGWKNIDQVSFEDNLLKVKLKKQIMLENYQPWFTSYNSNDKILEFTLTKESLQLAKLFSEAFDAKIRLEVFKKQDKIEYKNLLKTYLLEKKQNH
ncbi:PTS system glucose-specific IIBC component [Spiroplasma chinense]|uniref:PTS system glucose-specific IIBC component n=1 Tax=Spiroplasma chinense TaxID=216932 RepID=A0A5B9Y544_9MOLU|nr:PTS transporter subunit EIIC [Spiroplasma chinense]QEH61826.1 PTS system glucose-specific IIBC component [Spiroplasma chinense]